MRTSLRAYAALLGAVAAERGVELWLSHRHSRWAKERGGVEVARWQVVGMAALQTLLLAGSYVEVAERRRTTRLVAPMLSIVLLAQALRYWAVASLGPRWNVGVVVVPDMAPSTTGPYRYLRHPNYVAVALEGIALPLVHGAYVTAALFTALNTLMLSLRIGAEERALSRHGDYERLFAGRPRFIPRGSQQEVHHDAR